MQGKICAAVINMVIGLCIASLLSAVLSRTVVDAERSWQQPESGNQASQQAGCCSVEPLHVVVRTGDQHGPPSR